MADPVFLGIDVGTTNLKGAAFSGADGRLLARASRRLTTRVEPDGTREQSVEGLLEAVHSILEELRTSLSGRWAEVAGIGVAAQGGSGAIVDPRSGCALTALMLWNDSRAHCRIPEVAALRPAEYWRELSQRDGPGPGLARIRWLKETRPELFAGDRLYVGAGEIVFFHLTGEWRQDACSALQTGCYRVLEDRLDEEPLRLAGLPLAAVAPLREGHTVAGLSAEFAACSGLPSGLPVAGPYMDHEAGYLSAAHISERPLQCSLGTAWVGNFVVDTPRSGYNPVQLIIPAPTAGRSSLVIQPMLTGNVGWDWGLTRFLHADLPTALAGAEAVFREALLPPDGMLCLPWFTQANPALPDRRGGGAFLGAGVHASAADFVRALAAGMCFEFYRVLEDVKRGAAVDTVVLGGGASKGTFFRVLLAALFHPLPVSCLNDEDLAGARGTLHPLSATAVRSSPRMIPPPEATLRERIRTHYALYREQFGCLLGGVPSGAPYRLATAGAGRGA